MKAPSRIEADGSAERCEADGESEGSPWRWAGFGMELCGVMAIFGYGGYALDGYWDHGWPWLMVVGLTVGLVGMTYLLLKETLGWHRPG